MSINYEVESWLNSVTQENAQKIKRLSSYRKKLIYILKADDSNVLRVEPSVASIKSDGSCGQNVKSYDVSKINSGKEWPKYLDIDDISILAIINKTLGSSGFTQNGYDLQQITNTDLLEKIIKDNTIMERSKRCFEIVDGLGTERIINILNTKS